VRTPTGVPATGYTLVFHNAVTGDIMGSASGPYGPYRTRLFGPQRVTVEYYLPGTTGYVHGWYGGQDPAHATALTIPARGMPHLDLTIP